MPLPNKLAHLDQVVADHPQSPPSASVMARVHAVNPPDLTSMLPLGTLTGPLRACLQCLALLFADLMALTMAVVLALFLMGTGESFGAILSHPSEPNQLSIYAVLAVSWLFWFGLVKQVYTRRKPYWAELWQIVMGVLVFAVLDAALSGMSSSGFSRPQWAITWLSLLLLLPSARQVSRFLLRRFNLWYIPTVIIGHGDNAREAYLALKSEPSMGFEVKAFVALLTKNDRRSVARSFSPVADIPSVAVDAQSKDIRQLLPFHCVIAMDAHERMHRDAAIRVLNQNKINDVHVIPAMRGVPLYGMETSHFFSHEVLLIQLRNNLANPMHRICKRAFDLLGSVTLLLLLSPVFAVLAYKVSRDGGEPFFGHTRVGQNRKPFKCLKFRSMIVNAQEVLAHLLATNAQAKAEWDQDFKLKNDPRVSRLGNFMRRTSLDELPQLWNVLKGEMSLVGPRPVVQAELERYGDDVDYYLMAKPGITGLWQVSGRNDIDYATRVYLDAWYVKNWSLWSDIAILFKTISVVTRRSGAY